MIRKLKAIEEAEPVNCENEELQRLHERIIEKHRAMFKKLAISEDEERQKLYEKLVEKHKETLKKLAKH